jgi:ubiquinone/menaquinone biosynthesis C-methylase UbiE
MTQTSGLDSVLNRKPRRSSGNPALRLWSEMMNRLHRWRCRSGFWKKLLQNDMLPWALKDVDLGQNVLEVGPGPGLTTDLLRTRLDRITALEVDSALADLLKRRMSGTNVTVIQGDASAMPFEDATFSGAVAFTMLHHVPSPTLQDRLLREVHRVLRSGGMFVGTDSLWSPALWLFHIGDTLVPGGAVWPRPL